MTTTRAQHAAGRLVEAGTLYDAGLADMAATYGLRQLPAAPIDIRLNRGVSVFGALLLLGLPLVASSA